MKMSVISAAVAVALIGTNAAGASKDSPATDQRASSGSIDACVLARLKELNLQPAETCTDEVFLRRAYLDAIGTLPTSDEAKTFLQSRAPDKRSALIDRLLQRDEFADLCSMKWSDLLRVKAEFPINMWPNAAKAFHRWLHTCIRDNMPYDQFAREMITASGSNFRVAAVNFYRGMQSKEPETLAQGIALAFMGARADKWDKERLDGMATFFAYTGFKPTREWKEEVIFFDTVKALKDTEEGPLKPGVCPDGTVIELSADRDHRELFADWLITPENPWFTRSIVNRVWSWLMGRGIIHEPDDICDDNPPQNAELLALLQKELVAADYDLKHIFRLILNSKTYQQSCVPKSDPAAARENFACYIVRRLEAEVLIDALCQITGSTESYLSMIPEPFTFIPEHRRSITLPDGSITSPFLDMFGRPARDTGQETERNNKVTPAQRLHILNSTHIREKIEKSTILKPLLVAKGRDWRPNITGLYLVILSRFPTQEEISAVHEYSRAPETEGSKALQDLAWAMFNSVEFLFRH